MYPEMTPTQLYSEFSNFGFYGQDQQPYQQYQFDRYNNSYPSMHYSNLSQMNLPTNTYQLLNSIDNEKRKINVIKQETDSLLDSPEMQSSFAELRSFSESDAIPSITQSATSCDLDESTRSKSLSSSPPVSPQYNSNSNSPQSQYSTSDGESTTVKNKTKKSATRPRMYKFNPKPLTLNPQMKRINTPSDNKNDEYWEKRKKNNEASRRSRLARRLKECMVMEEMKKLRQENEQLKAELLKMQNVTTCRI